MKEASYAVHYAGDAIGLEKWMNDRAEEGYRFMGSVATQDSGKSAVIMEYLPILEAA